jgi:hypothetical protein
MPVHRDMTGDELHDPYHYKQSSDPGAVGAGRYWLDTVKGWLHRRNSADTRWLLVNDGSFFDPLWYGAAGDGTTDDTTAIQACFAAAKANGTNRETKILFRGLRTYVISDTLTLPSGGWVEGESFSGAQGPMIHMKSTADITKHAFAMEATDRSRVCFRNLRVEDNRTSTSRTGNGIHINDVTNGSIVENCFVSHFYRNIFIGGESSGQEADCVQVRDCWLISPLDAGLYIWRLNNRAIVQNLMVDTWSSAPQAAVVVTGTSGSSGVSIETLKHENYVDGTHGVLISGGGQHSVRHYTMRGTVSGGANPNSDCVRVQNATAALTLTLEGINAKNTAVAYGEDVTTAGNLFNLASSSASQYTPFTIPVSHKSIALFVLSQGNTTAGGPTGGFWNNGTVHRVGAGAPTYSAPKGSTHIRTDGSSSSTRFYINTDGGTTWTSLTTAA